MSGAAAASPPSPAAADEGPVRRLVLCMCAAQLLAASGLGAYPALLPRLAEAWSLSGTQAGLVGGVLFLGYVAATPFLTSLTDRVDARRVYLSSVLVAASGAAAFAVLADGFAGALLAQALFGVGFAGLYMPGLKALADRIPEERRPRASGLYSTLMGAGMAISFALAGAIDALLGWRWVFALVAGNALAAGALALCVLHPKAPPPAARRLGMVEGFRRVPANRPALGYVLAYAAHCWEIHGFRSWMIAFLAFAAARDGGAGGAGAAAGAIAAAVAVASLFWNIGCNEAAERVGRVRMLSGIMAAAFVAALLASQSWQLPFAAAAALACAYYLAANSDAGVLNAGLVEAAVPVERGATLAVYSMAGYVAGFLGPAAAGLVLDLAGGIGSGEAWTAAFLTMSAPGLLGMWALRRLTAAPGPPALALAPAVEPNAAPLPTVLRREA